MSSRLFDWAESSAVGGITEVAVLAPIRLGRVPNEQRTYEERALSVVENFGSRVEQGLPNELNLVPSIHFGRIMLIRPEQYLWGSNVKGVAYQEHQPPLRQRAREGGERVPPPPSFRLPMPFDEYLEEPDRPGIAAGKPGTSPELRSFLLTTVEFDGDLKVYFREISVQLADRFNIIFQNCEQFPGTEDFEAFWLWIRRFQIRTQLFYAANPNLTTARIRQLEVFKRRFDQFVARVRAPGAPPARALDDLFDQFLRDNLQFGEGFPYPSGIFQTPDERSER